jgi:DNA-binding beta-propeller fold protein YncE
MIRFTLLGLAAILFEPAFAATPTVYAEAPYPIFAPSSVTTFKPFDFIPDLSGAGGFVRGPDAIAFYGVGGPGVVSFDANTGKTLRTYQTEYPIPQSAHPFAVVPNNSQLYVATCANYNSGTGTPCYAGYVEVFDIASEKRLAALSFGSDQVFGVVASPDSRTVYAYHYYNEPESDCCDQPSAPSGSVTAIEVASRQIGASFVPPNEELPLAMVITPDSQTAYVLCYEQGVTELALYAVSVPGMSETATLNTPTIFTYGILMLSEDGSTLVLQTNAESGGEVFLLFSTSTGDLIETLPGSGNLAAVSPDATTLYSLAGASRGSFITNLETIDVASGAVNTVVTGEYIAQIVLPPHAVELWVILQYGSGVLSFAEGTSSPTTLYNAGGFQNWLAVSPRGDVLYSADEDGVWAISTATGKLVSNLLEGTTINAIAASPNDDRLYALDANSFSFLTVNAATGAIENTIALPQCTSGYILSGSLAINAAGTLAYAIVNPCGQVVAIDLRKQKIIGSIPGTNGPGLGVNPANGYIWAGTGTQASSVEVFDLATQTVIGTVPLAASSIAFSPDGGTAYIAGAQNNVNGVGVVDTSTLAVTAFIPGNGGGSGQSIAVTPDGTFIYVGGGDVINAQTLQVVGPFGASAPVVIH